MTQRITTEAWPIEWDAGWLPPDAERERLEAAVRADVDWMQLEAPSHLILHHCTPDGDDKPWVFVYGAEGSPAIHCRYDRNPAYG